MPHEAADVVRRLDVEVERAVDGGADRRDLGEREVGREVDRARAELLEDARRCRIRGREHHRDLRLHLRGQQPGRPHRRERREDADVRDQDAAEPVLRRAARVVEAGDDLLLAACAAARRRAPAGERAIAEMSQAAFGRAKSETSTVAAAARRAISSSSASVWRKTPLPWETRWTRTSSRSASSSTASRQRGPSVLGISIRYWAPSGKRFAESGSSFRSPPREADRAQEVAGPCSWDPGILQVDRRGAPPAPAASRGGLLVVGVGALALDAEPVEDGNAERGDEVAVGAAAGRRLAGGRGRARGRSRAPRAKSAAGRSTARAAAASTRRRPRSTSPRSSARARARILSSALQVGPARDADVEPRLRERRDDVLARPAADDADVDRRGPVVVGQRVEREHLVRELLDCADTVAQARSAHAPAVR